MILNFTYSDGTKGSVSIAKVGGVFTYTNIPVVTPAPPPMPSAGFTALKFNAGTQDFKDSLGPGQSKLYVFYVLPGVTGFSMNVSMISQTANLDMVLVKGPTPPGVQMAAYMEDALAFYGADLINRSGTPYFKKYELCSVWAKIGQDQGGEGIYLKTSAKIPPVDAYGFAASIPGTYFVMVKNQSKTVSASFYVYAKQ
jgi:hypothetical protein